MEQAGSADDVFLPSIQTANQHHSVAREMHLQAPGWLDNEAVHTNKPRRQRT